MNSDHLRQRNMIILVKGKTKSPVNNASKNLKIFLTIEISLVRDFESPSCNVANASVVLIPCHSGKSHPVSAAGNCHFSASGGYFAAIFRISPYSEKTHFSE